MLSMNISEGLVKKGIDRLIAKYIKNKLSRSMSVDLKDVDMKIVNGKASLDLHINVEMTEQQLYEMIFDKLLGV